MCVYMHVHVCGFIDMFDRFLIGESSEVNQGRSLFLHITAIMSHKTRVTPAGYRIVCHLMNLQKMDLRLNTIGMIFLFVHGQTYK